MQTPFISGAGEAPRVSTSIVVAFSEPESGRVVRLDTVYMHECSREVAIVEVVVEVQRHAQTLGLGQTGT